MKMSPSVHAVLLNWNRFDDTVECIDSLKRSSVPIVRIIVLDQASPDGSGGRLERFYIGDDQIVLIHNESNCGFAAGVNVGIRHALAMGAEMVFLINNDTIVANDCIRDLSEAFSLNPLTAAAGPAILYYSNPERLWQAGGYFNKIKMGITVPSKGKNLSEIDQTKSLVTFLTGCALLIHKNTFERVGFFDTTYFFYGEDVDYGLRIADAGLNMYFVPTARVLHKIEDIATDRTSPFVLYHLAKSTVIMLRKRFSGPARWYGIALQFTIYTAFRCWQILKGGKGLDSIAAWLSGLFQGVREKIRV